MEKGRNLLSEDVREASYDYFYWQDGMVYETGWYKKIARDKIKDLFIRERSSTDGFYKIDFIEIKELNKGIVTNFYYDPILKLKLSEEGLWTHYLYLTENNIPSPLGDFVCDTDKELEKILKGD